MLHCRDDFYSFESYFVTCFYRTKEHFVEKLQKSRNLVQTFILNDADQKSQSFLPFYRKSVQDTAYPYAYI
jgi:hypothetical protein